MNSGDAGGMPILTGPADVMRSGLDSFAHKYSSANAERIAMKESENSWKNHLMLVRQTYGSHMAMSLEMERQAGAFHQHRLPGLRTSKISMDTRLGRDTTINFEDYLNAPTTRVSRPMGVHTAMETKLNLL